MDFFGFAKPGTEFKKPQLADFAEDQGYDYYAYEMAMDQWLSQFPNLSERWCGLPPLVVDHNEPSLDQILMDALTI